MGKKGYAYITRKKDYETITLALKDPQKITRLAGIVESIKRKTYTINTPHIQGEFYQIKSDTHLKEWLGDDFPGKKRWKTGPEALAIVFNAYRLDTSGAPPSTPKSLDGKASVLIAKAQFDKDGFLPQVRL